MFFHELETDRLYLKNISGNDRDFIFRQFSDAEVSRYLFDEEPFGAVEEADGLIEFYNEPEPRGQHRWILVKKDGGEKIGTCGFHCWDRNSDVCELGYDLYPDFQKQGYMKEALSAALLFARENMNLHEICACIYPENIRSINAAVNQGFSYGGEDRIYTFRGTDYNHFIYTLSL